MRFFASFHYAQNDRKAKVSMSTTKKPKIIGLTGPIASGKNEVAKILRSRGAYIIDADKIGHSLLKSKAIKKRLVKTFGKRILDSKGKVARKKLGDIVFNDPKLLKKLNKIIHPVMKKEIIRESCKPSAVSRKLIVINAAVLKEMGLISFVDEVWVVLAPKKKRLKWLMKKGVSRQRAFARIRSQMSDREYLKIADRIIRNNVTARKLKEKVNALIKSYL